MIFGYAMNVTGKYPYNANNFITPKRYSTSSLYKNRRTCKLHKVLQLEVKYRDNRPNNQGNKPSGETHPPNPGKQTHQGNKPSRENIHPPNAWETVPSGNHTLSLDAAIKIITTVFLMGIQHAYISCGAMY